MFILQLSRQCRTVAVATQSIAAMEFSGVFPRLDERTVATGVHRHIALHDFQNGQHIGVDLADMHIAGQGGDADDIHARLEKRQHDGLSIVNASIGINQ